MKNKNKFAYVKYDYREHSTGEIAIDAYPTKRQNDDNGRVVAWVTPDGVVNKGTSPLCEPDDLECPNVQAAIQKAKDKQEDIKQRLADEVLEELKKDMKHGDYTVLDELLKLIPTSNLIQSLPEEQWKKYSPVIK